MSKGRQSRKEDFEKASSSEKAEGGGIEEQLARLEHDSKGMFTFRLEKPHMNISKKDVENDFGHYGKISDIHFTDKFVYLRFSDKETAERAFRGMFDTYKLQVPSVSKGWNAKEKEDVTSKVSKLQPDTRGWYSIRIRKPSNDFKQENAEAEFGKFGEIADCHFTEKFIYIRYLSWKEAANAVKELSETFDVDIPNISSHWKPQKSHADKGPQIYIGDISPKASKEEIAELLEPFMPMDYKFYSVNNRYFAFAYFESTEDCKRVVAALNGKLVRGSALVIRLCRDKSRARYIADDDYQYKKGSQKKGGKGKKQQQQPVFQDMGYSTIVELYVSNFPRIVTQRQLEVLFSSHGSIAYVEMVHVEKSEACKAYVGMYSAYEAKQAMHKLNQRMWHKLKLNVAYSTRRNANKSKGSGGGASDFNSNPVDRANSLANKMDVMLEDVLDQCDFCTKIRSMMSDLQQALRVIKYQVLRGEVVQGLSMIENLLGKLEEKQQAGQHRLMMSPEGMMPRDMPREPLMPRDVQPEPMMPREKPPPLMGLEPNRAMMAHEQEIEAFYQGYTPMRRAEMQSYGNGDYYGHSQMSGFYNDGPGFDAGYYGSSGGQQGAYHSMRNMGGRGRGGRK